MHGHVGAEKRTRAQRRRVWLPGAPARTGNAEFQEEQAMSKKKEKPKGKPKEQAMEAASENPRGQPKEQIDQDKIGKTKKKTKGKSTPKVSGGRKGNPKK